MEALKQVIPLLLALSLGGLVVGVGLNATRRDLLYVLSRRGLLFKAILAVNVIPVTAAIALTYFLPLDLVVKAGIILMALSPVPPLVPSQELSLGARRSYAYGIYMAMVLLTIVVVPISLWAAGRVMGHQAAIPFTTMAKTLTTGVLIPLGIGLGVRELAPAFAARAAPWLYRLSMVLIVLAFLPILVSIWPAIVNLVGRGALAVMAAVVLIALAGGHLLGGPELRDRATLAIASSVRHPGIAMMLANANFTNKGVTAAVLMFLLVGIVVGVPYKLWIKRGEQHASAAQSA
jgi:BASS family bile acid:Na+ symporter